MPVRKDLQLFILKTQTRNKGMQYLAPEIYVKTNLLAAVIVYSGVIFIFEYNGFKQFEVKRDASA